ncbi:MAG: hypothetical protein ACLRSD_12295 [Oscillibacter sp.]
MGENDSQQGGDGEKSQLPTEENEKTAIQLYVEKKVARPLTHGISMMRMFACRGWFM